MVPGPLKKRGFVRPYEDWACGDLRSCIGSGPMFKWMQGRVRRRKRRCFFASRVNKTDSSNQSRSSIFATVSLFSKNNPSNEKKGIGWCLLLELRSFTANVNIRESVIRCSRQGTRRAENSRGVACPKYLDNFALKHADLARSRDGETMIGVEPGGRLQYGIFGCGVLVRVTREKS